MRDRTLFEQPPNTVHNAIRYADFAVGELFRLARQQPYFANTPFLIVADHDTRVFGADLVPIEKLHIPGLILGPGVPVGRFDRLASQVDLLPIKPPLEFTYRHGKLVRAPLDPDFARDALAHVLLADMLYHEQRYRLPGESRSRQDAG